MPYRWGAAEGRVRAEVAVNADPAALGCDEFARGFPYCRATVEAPGAGYQYLHGWLQVVDHSDGDEGFEIDQFPQLMDASHPFCYWGYSPAFFDAPHSDELEDWDFLATTFLCGFRGRLLEFRREACALLGFSWGFVKRGRRVERFGPTLLPPQDWDRHLDYLTERYAGSRWSFAPGFRQDPLRP